MSNALNDLIKHNPVPMLRHFACSDSDALKKQINHIQEGKDTFFISLINMTFGYEIHKDIYELCKEYGYSALTVTKPLQELGLFSIENVPDYLRLWAKVDDRFLAEVTADLSLDIDKLDKQYHLLEKAYRKGKINTIKVLEGLGLAKNYENESLLSYAQENPEGLRAYWDTRDNQEEKFLSISTYIEKSIAEFRQAGGQYERVQSEALEKYLDIEIPKLNQYQQEDIIALLATGLNQKPFEHAVKLIGKKVKNYQGDIVPLWRYADIGKSHKLLYHLLDSKIPLDSKISLDSQQDKKGGVGDLHHDSHNGELQYLDMLANLLHNMGYRSQGHHYTGNRNEGNKIRSIQNKLRDVFDADFWLTTNKSDNHPWFYTACKNSRILNLFQGSWLHLIPKEINYYNHDQKIYPLAVFEHLEKSDNLYWSEYSKKAVTKDLLSKTWLYQDETGTYAIEHAIKNAYQLLYNENVSNAMIQYLKDEYLPFKVQETMIYNLVKSGPNKLFKELLDSLQSCDEMDWQKLLNHTKSITYHNTAAIIEALAPIVTKKNLDKSLPEKKESHHARKI